MTTPTEFNPTPEQFPNIGPDPLQGNVDRSPEAAMARLFTPYSVQQKEVPDQTCLVWRFDVSQVCGDLIWRTAAMNSLNKENETLRSQLDALKAEMEGINKYCNSDISYGPAAIYNISLRAQIALAQLSPK